MLFRVAQIACLGFAAQYAATGKGPLDNLVGRGEGSMDLAVWSHMPIRW